MKRIGKISLGDIGGDQAAHGRSIFYFQRKLEIMILILFSGIDWSMGVLWCSLDQSKEKGGKETEMIFLLSLLQA